MRRIIGTIRAADNHRRVVLLVSVVMLFVGFTGCYSPPFEQPDMTELPPDTSAGEVADQFERSLPQQFQTEDTIIFQFSRLLFSREIAALGYAEVNRAEDTFDILCVNHTGAELFHIQGDREGTQLLYAMPEFKKHPEFTDAVGDDLRAIYWAMSPGSKTRARVRRNKIVFSNDNGDGPDERKYIYGGPELALLEKWIVDDGVERRVRFYEYSSHERDGQKYVFPEGIVLHNRTYGYRLIIRNRGLQIN
ncbi:MAG: hypothetical protein ACOCR1_01360 [Planctomycetota bacterium]